MDFQTLFYIIGIIFMLTVLSLIFCVALIVWYVRKKALQLIRKPQDSLAGIVSALALKFKNWGR